MEVMRHLMQKLKHNLIDHRCIVATPADPTLHYLQCILAGVCGVGFAVSAPVIPRTTHAHETFCSWDQHYLSHRSPRVSLYNPPPHGERTLLATLVTCRFNISSSEIFPGDVSGCGKTYTPYLEPLQLIEYALLFKDRCLCLLPLFFHAFYYV